MQIDTHRGAPPLYLQVKNDLKRKIEEGIYPRGSLIPPEPQLEKMFHVSRITIRQAIMELVKEGYVNKKRGKGTSVTYSDKINENASAIRSFTTELEYRGMIPGTSYVSIESIPASKEIRDLLELAPQEKVYCLVRIRTANKKPIVLFQTYIPGRYDLSLKADDYRGDITIVDTKQMLLLHIECKNQQKWSLPKWIKQAESDCPEGRVPIVIFHEHNTSNDYVTLSLEDFLNLVPKDKVVGRRSFKK